MNSFTVDLGILCPRIGQKQLTVSIQIHAKLETLLGFWLHVDGLKGTNIVALWWWLYTAFNGKCAHGRVEWENVEISLTVEHKVAPGEMNFLFQG